MWPPRPPSPPSGPPLSTCASRLNDIIPFPPLPAWTEIVISSINLAIYAPFYKYNIITFWNDLKYVY
ncbi:Hypothetical protein MCYN_0373 [Mycoplasmopsis cynos C142]|uniref:Uncharacterized protein n=1 Tax=Mycoplasmopsis cynos (strain C142) TaxID=1246955 RepID=L0RX59_MYCC1|nr:Hypothetical protein MCYN_0373 [Mycoplasmopsis cynos C142]